jgi:hypothetical protein
MTIEEFIRRADLPVEVYNRVVDDFQSMDRKQWLQTWGDYMAENFNGWNEVDEVKQAKPLANRIANAFGDVKFAPKGRYKDDVYRAEFSDVPRDQFDAALAKMKEYYDAEVKGRHDQAMRKKRETEVKNWGFLRNAIASEYEKQRYVDKPETALFGKQAPRIGSAPETRWGSAADLGLGAAGAAADVLPGWGGILAGPAIRGVRDVGHIITDSPYRKEWGTIGSDLLADVGINAGANFLTNFRTVQRGATNAGKVSPVGQVVELDQIGKGLSNPKVNALYYQLLDEVAGNTKKLTNTDIVKIVSELPDSPIKGELMGMIGDLNHIDRIGMVKAMSKWRDLNAARGSSTIAMLREQIDNPTGAGVYQEQFGGVKFPTSNDAYGQYFNKVVTEPKLSNGQQVMRMLMNTVKKADTPIGAAAVKEGKSVFGGRGSEATIARTSEDVEALNEIKNREARFWEAGFAPKKVDGDPLWEAYREWYMERTGDEPGGGAR